MKPLKKIEISESSDVLAGWLFDLPVLGYDASMEVINATESLKKAKDGLQDYEDRMLIEITKEVDETTGKPVYGSQSIREAEMRIRLMNDSEYKVIKYNIREMENIITKLKHQSEYYSTMFSAVKNEVYHRRRQDELDAMRDMQKSKAESMKVE